MFLPGIILLWCTSLTAGIVAPLCCDDFPPLTLEMHTTTVATESVIEQNEQQLRHVAALIDELRSLRNRQKHAFESWQKQCTEQVQGDTGIIGDPGFRGEKGSKGDRGQWGEYGPEGGRGQPGSEGFAGQDGTRGSIGPTGDIGPDGIPGSVHEVHGQKGDLGPIGQEGLKGGAGETGYQGPRGQLGDHGSPGITGAASYCCNTVGPKCCNPGWTVNEDHTKCFFVDTTAAARTTFTGANSTCYTKYGGQLASVTSVDDNSLIYSLLGTYSNGDIYLWIGGQQLGPFVADPTTGWTWTDGSVWNITNWAPGQPAAVRVPGCTDPGDTAQCLEMFTLAAASADQGLWGNGCCDNAQPFACETLPLTLNSDCTP